MARIIHLHGAPELAPKIGTSDFCPRGHHDLHGDPDIGWILYVDTQDVHLGDCKEGKVARWRQVTQGLSANWEGLSANYGHTEMHECRPCGTLRFIAAIKGACPKLRKLAGPGHLSRDTAKLRAGCATAGGGGFGFCVCVGGG